MSNTLLNQPLVVTVRSREKILFKGETISLSSVNDRGPFDILAGHENFISIVKDQVRLNEDGKEIPFTTGVLRVQDNTVSVYIGLTDMSKPLL